jgi:proline racemase
VTPLQRRSVHAVPSHVRHRLAAVDSHTCGQQTRVIVDGLPELDGGSIAEVRDTMAADYDWIRRVAALEPRGQRSMFVAAIVPAFDRSCVCGVVFMDPAGYHDMCGHATIGVITTLIDLGYVECGEGENELAVETPAGPIPVRVLVRDGRAEHVAFVNRPAYVLERRVLSLGETEAEVTVAFGGQWYAFLDASAVGLRVRPEEIDALVARASDVRTRLAAGESHPAPDTGQPPRIGNIVWCDSPSTVEAHARNVPVNAAGGFDRSPCGTATCARLAILHDEGALAVGETFVNQGLVGTLYKGRIVRLAEVAGVPAVVPEIEGSAWLTGGLDLWVDDTDPFPEGFLV